MNVFHSRIQDTGASYAEMLYSLDRPLGRGEAEKLYFFSQLQPVYATSAATLRVA